MQKRRKRALAEEGERQLVRSARAVGASLVPIEEVESAQKGRAGSLEPHREQRQRASMLGEKTQKERKREKEKLSKPGRAGSCESASRKVRAADEVRRGRLMRRLRCTHAFDCCAFNAAWTACSCGRERRSEEERVSKAPGRGGAEREEKGTTRLCDQVAALLDEAHELVHVAAPLVEDLVAALGLDERDDAGRAVDLGVDRL